MLDPLYIDPRKLAILTFLLYVLCKCMIDQYTIKPVLRGHLKKRPKIGFQDPLLLNAGQKYCRLLQGEHSAIDSSHSTNSYFPLEFRVSHLDGQKSIRQIGKK